jgi:hypothetical protein
MRCTQGQNVSIIYVEQSDRRSISSKHAEKIRSYARGLWRNLYSRGLAPKKWSDAPLAVQDEYAHDMEARWFEL